MKQNKNLGENRKESQLPSKSGGCNEITRFQGQLQFPRQAGDVPQPCRTGCNWFPKCNVSHETLQKLLLGKTIFSVRQKGVPPLLLPTSVLQLPRCLVRICNLFHKDNQIANWKVSKVQLQQEKQIAKFDLLRKCGLLAHTSAAFLKNCCIEKLFRMIQRFP